MAAESLRDQLIETALEMNASGLNRGTSGNVSVRDGDGMLITPSGIRYEELGADDIVRVGADGRSVGANAPSSEWRIHHDVYAARPDATAIVHAHPLHCSALACLRRPIPAFHYMVAVAGGDDIRCAEYATFGTQALSDAALRALESRKACLMANHGLLAFGSDLASALALAQEVEHLAATYLLALSAGEPVLLGSEEMSRVLGKFRHYRPDSDTN